MLQSYKWWLIWPWRIEGKNNNICQKEAVCESNTQVEGRFTTIQHTLHTLRLVPFPQRKQVQDELNRMESHQRRVIPLHSMVVVLKWKCVCEVHLIPRVEEVLAQLTWVTIFSKYDTNSGFWQIPLSPESCPLTAFIMGGIASINCLSEYPVYQNYLKKCMNKIIEGLEEVTGLIDDTLVYGKDMAERVGWSNGKTRIRGKLPSWFTIPKNLLRSETECGTSMFLTALVFSGSPLTPSLLINWPRNFMNISWKPILHHSMSHLTQLKVSADEPSFGVGAVLFQHEDQCRKLREDMFK